MRRNTKWFIIIAIFCLIVITIGLIVYGTVFNKNTYSVAAVEHTTYKPSDFRSSELKFYPNGTFHLQVVYNQTDIFFTGIGTYTKDRNGYTLTFIEVLGRQNDTLSDQMAKFAEPVVCVRSGNRLKFIDHNQQVYYFG